MILRFGTPACVLLGGVPGSGKTTLLKRQFLHNVRIVSADDCRGRVQVEHGFGYDDFIEAAIPKARVLFFKEIAEAFGKRKSVLLEAVYVTEHSRREMIDLARASNYGTHLVMVEAFLDECLAGMADRDRKVPDTVLTDYYEQWLALRESLRANKLDAGLHTATVVRRSDLDNLTLDFSDASALPTL